VPNGDYDPLTHTWAIPGVMLPNDTFELIIYAQVVGEGVTYNVAEVTGMDQADLDSTPDNDDPSEDDQSGVCIQATVTLE